MTLTQTTQAVITKHGGVSVLAPSTASTSFNQPVVSVSTKDKPAVITKNGGVSVLAPSTTSKHPVVSVSTNDQQAAFSISRLPPELRCMIYGYYFKGLAPIDVGVEGGVEVGELLCRTPLVLASRFFEGDVPVRTFCSCATIAFGGGVGMRGFVGGGRDGEGKGEGVRRIRVLCGRGKGKMMGEGDWDWVYLMNVCFGGVEEVTCEIGGMAGGGEGHMDMDCFGAWWGCVRDAVREGWCCKRVGGGKRSTKLVLRCEVDGVEIAREVLRCRNVGFWKNDGIDQ